VVRWVYVDLIQVGLVWGWLFVAVGQGLGGGVGFLGSRVGVAGEDDRLVVGQACVGVVVGVGVVAVFGFEEFWNRLC
jgi:hypothetical protein